MSLNKLSNEFASNPDLAPGRYSDGGNLYLNVSAKLTKSWVFMYSRDKGPRREMGLGPYPGMTLDMARSKAAEARGILEDGEDPIEFRRKTSGYRYTVRGKWPFPYDMVRYDGSRPATEEDEEKIRRYSMEYAPDRDVFKDVEIELVGPRRPNVARWDSFGWSVPTEDPFLRSRAVRERSDQEIRKAALAKLTSEERRVLGL